MVSKKKTCAQEFEFTQLFINKFVDETFRGKSREEIALFLSGLNKNQLALIDGCVRTLTTSNCYWEIYQISQVVDAELFVYGLGSFGKFPAKVTGKIQEIQASYEESFQESCQNKENV